MWALVAHPSLDPLPLEVTFSIMCSDARCRSRRRVRSTGVGGVCCVVVRRRVVQGALRGRVGLPGVVAVCGWSLSRWFDAHCQGVR